MSDPLIAGAAAAPTAEDRSLPAVAYALYFLSFCTGITLIAGIIVAYVARGGSGPIARSHYDFLIRTFWIGLAAALVGGALVVVGLPLMLILIGFPIMAFGWTILGLLGVWFLVRLVLGAIHLARGEAYPRPYAWLF
jgi:uncharacterized membrane protein